MRYMFVNVTDCMYIHMLVCVMMEAEWTSISRPLFPWLVLSLCKAIEICTREIERERERCTVCGGIEMIEVVVVVRLRRRRVVVLRGLRSSEHIHRRQWEWKPITVTIAVVIIPRSHCFVLSSSWWLCILVNHLTNWAKIAKGNVNMLMHYMDIAKRSWKLRARWIGQGGWCKKRGVNV